MPNPAGVNVLYCVGAAFITVGLVLHIVGLATPKWTVSNRSNLSLGLWKWCPDICKDFPDNFWDPFKPHVSKIVDAFNSARAFAILGMFSGMCAMGLTCIYLIKLRNQNVNSNLLKNIVLCTSILSIVFIAISISCFVAGFQVKIEGHFQEDFKAGYSIFLSGFGCAAISFGGILFYLSGRNTVQSYVKI